jgi:hypothetical protein
MCDCSAVLWSGKNSGPFSCPAIIRHSGQLTLPATLLLQTLSNPLARLQPTLLRLSCFLSGCDCKLSHLSSSSAFSRSSGPVQVHAMQQECKKSLYFVLESEVRKRRSRSIQVLHRIASDRAPSASATATSSRSGRASTRTRTRTRARGSRTASRSRSGSRQLLVCIVG